MKALVGCAQPVHSVLRSWIGSTSLTSRSNRSGQPVPPSSNHGSITTSTVRIALISTPRSISTTRDAGRHRTPTSPPLVLGNTCLRRLSGIGGIAGPEERGAVTRVRLESKSGGNVDVARPLEGAPIDLDDLQDLNAEIAGFVGSLGDPDFDVQDNVPTASPASDRRTNGPHHRTGKCCHMVPCLLSLGLVMNRCCVFVIRCLLCSCVWRYYGSSLRFLAEGAR